MRVFGRHPGKLPRRRACGMTLVEVVIAIFVLSVGVLSIVALFPAGYHLSQTAVWRSVGALAARDAQARITAEVRRSGGVGLPAPSSLPDYKRVGTVAKILSNTTFEGCILNDPGENPSWSGLNNWYVVMTSGAASGGLYDVQSASGRNIILFGTKLRRGTATVGEPIRVGDHFALIGNTDFPTNFLGTGSNRTIPIANQGDAEADPDDWRYSYGCIISPSAPEAKHLNRVDIFVYDRFSDGATIGSQASRPVGHFVTYVHSLDDYAHP